MASRATITLSAALVVLSAGFHAPAQIVRQNPPGGGVVRTIPQPAPSAPSYMRIRVEQDVITAEIVSTPLPRVLEELAARTGVVFELAIQDVTPVSLALYRVSLHEAIERLAGDNNSIFYYETDEAGQSRIRFVRLFPRASKGQQASLRYVGTGGITKTGDDSVDTPDQAMKVLAESPNLEARQKAVEVLAGVKGEAAEQALTKALADTAPEVRVGAIEGLAGMGARAALPQIILALKDSHPGVRQSAIMAIALVGDAENVRDVKPLTRDKDASVAAAAEIALKKLALRRP